MMVMPARTRASRIAIRSGSPNLGAGPSAGELPPGDAVAAEGGMGDSFLHVAVGRDGRAAPLFRDNVRERLREGPLVTRWVLGAVLTFAVLEVRRLHKDARAVFPRPLAMVARVLPPHHHRMRRLGRARRTSIAPHVADDQRSIAEPELRPG